MGWWDVDGGMVENNIKDGLLEIYQRCNYEVEILKVTS